MTEDFIRLNVHELGIILYSLKNLEIREQNIVSRDYGSALVLYDKLHSIFENMDTSKVELRHDITPSF